MASRAARMAASSTRRPPRFAGMLAEVRALIQLAKIAVIAAVVVFVLVMIATHKPAAAPAHGGQPATQATP